MKFMPDSAVIGTIGHARRRAAKRKARARKGNARRPQAPTKMSDVIGGIALMIGFMLILSLFV